VSLRETKQQPHAPCLFGFRKMEDEQLEDGEKTVPDIRGTERFFFWSRADGADKVMKGDAAAFWRQQNKWK
jgi:hypothetical protein